MKKTEHLITHFSQGVLKLEMNRPKVNALDTDLSLSLLNAFQIAAKDESVRCVLLMGKGKNFSAGQEMTEIQHALTRPKHEETYRWHLQQTYNPLILQIRHMPIPVLAGIQGAVSGAALGIALACDLRIAAEDARFVVGFGGIGLVPDCAVSLLLPSVIGLGRAAEFCFTNNPISAHQALEWGLVNRLVATEVFAKELSAFAEQLARGPVKAMGLAKRAFNKAILPNLEQALDYEAQLQEIASRGREHLEGLQAFSEKRRPIFSS